VRANIEHFLRVLALLLCAWVAHAAGLRAEAGAEHIPVYGLNRGAGALREVAKRAEEPLTPVSPIVGGIAEVETVRESYPTQQAPLGADGKSLSDMP
jgi:hypothetical protein